MIRTKAVDGSFDYQMREGTWHLLILRWRPDEATVQLMVKVEEGRWSHVDDWSTASWHHPQEAIGLLRDNPRKFMRRLRDHCSNHNGPLEDHVTWVLDHFDAGSYRAKGVT